MNLHEQLKAMSLDELRIFADRQGVPVHWKAKPETIIKQIIDKVANPVRHTDTQQPNVEEPKITPLMAKRLKDAEESAHNTPEMIEEAIAAIKARVPDFKSEYDRKENTWTFTCKGAVDSGNIFIPIRRIVRIAEIISRGRLMPRALNQHFDSMNTATGQNSYTNTVLAP